MGNTQPDPDPRIGEAAVMSSQLGQDTLAYMKEQGEITNGWAEEDRSRWKETFKPLQDNLIADAQSWDSPDRKQMVADQARADVATASQQAVQQQGRSLTAMGVDPTSGRYADANQKMVGQTALASAGAANTSRRSVEVEADAKRAAVVNMGSGLPVQAAQMLGQGTSAVAGGASSAMQGYQQSANLYQMDYQNRVQAANSKNSAFSEIAGAAGQIAGMAFLSDETAKTDKRPARGVLKQVKDMPVEEWTYKKGMGDEGRHVGPYAQDFKRATGRGDGKSINIVDAFGMTLGAVQELSAQVDRLEQGKGKMRKVA